MKPAENPKRSSTRRLHVAALAAKDRITLATDKASQRLEAQI